ncbi:MAG: hypothetical protein EBT48_04515 [Verrucomicrobia bacterium]|nr:hypothetical protein [Verrucomicrobiota bacterium]
MRIRLDEKWMGMAVALAKRAGNSTRPNPRVGAVVVKNKKVVGEGFHRKAGDAHAEVEALRKAGVKGSLRDFRAVFDPWKDASMHRSDRGIWNPAGDLWCGGCGSEKCGMCESNSFSKKDPGRERDFA